MGILEADDTPDNTAVLRGLTIIVAEMARHHPGGEALGRDIRAALAHELNGGPLGRGLSPQQSEVMRRIVEFVASIPQPTPGTDSE